MGFFDFIPWRLERKVSQVGRVVAKATSPGRPRYTPRNYEAMAREGYTSNAYVYRAIKLIAANGASLPWRLYHDATKVKEVTRHPMLDLMRAPNPENGGTSFWISVISYLLMSGNSYIEAIRPTTGNRPAVELWSHRPDRMRVIPGADGRVAKYEYAVAGRSVTMDAATVLHTRLFHPLDDWYGLSPIQPASRSVDQHNAANDWNTALFQNDARPAGVLSTTYRLNPDQRKTLKDDLRQTNQGTRNARFPMVLESGLTWQQTGTNPTDMDWLGGKTQAAREIAVALDVASELLGDSANKTFNNVGEARRSLYTETIIPLMCLVRDGLNSWLLPMYGDDSLWGDFDTSGVECLQEDHQIARQFAIDGWKSGLLTLNAALRKCGEEEIGPEGDVRLIPNTMSVQPEAPILDVPAQEEDNTEPPVVLPTPGRGQAAALPPPAAVRALLGASGEGDDAELAFEKHWRALQRKRQTRPRVRAAIKRGA